MTRITINLPLVDARYCKGCPHELADLCDVFRTKRGYARTRRKVRVNYEWTYKRLPECIAATVEEVAGE